MSDAYPVISLFTGAGGLDLGVEDAGGTVRVCVEPDPDCAKTLLHNARFFPEAEILDDKIENIDTDRLLEAARLDVGEAALLLGGAPCQPWSKSGYWLGEDRLGPDDPRASLLDEFVDVLRATRPEGFIFENVPSILHPDHRPELDRFIRRARRAGYSVVWWRLHAAEYGSPQSRVRVFVVGLDGARVSAPQPTHWWRETDREGRLLPPETAGRWIAGYDTPELAEDGEGVKGRWAEHLREIPPGWNYKYLTTWAGHPRPSFVAQTKYWSFLLKLAPRRPSWTIQATPGPWTGPFHWQSRRLRIPELAALQTFPPTYRFEGERRSQQRQIGNAVPCKLASAVAQAVLSEIAGTTVRRGRRLRYRLADGYDYGPIQHRPNTHVW